MMNLGEVTGKDKQLLNIRKELFRIATLDSLEIDYSSHEDNKALGLINFIKVMNYDSNILFRSFLRNVHPFQIYQVNFVDRKHFSFMIASFFHMPLMTEIEVLEERTKISFHELSWCDTKYDSQYMNRDSLLICPNDISFCPIGKSATFPVSVLLGFISIDLLLYGSRVSEDLISVSKTVYEDELKCVSNKLFEKYIEENGMIANYFNEPQTNNKLDITAYSAKLQNEVSLLLNYVINNKSAEASLICHMKMSELRRQFDFEIVAKNILDEISINNVKKDHLFFVSTPDGEILEESID